MAQVRRSVIVPYTAEQMYRLVDDVERYAEFLPWCGGTRVHERSENATVASLDIDYMRIRQSFSTANRNQPPHLIEMTLREGPFKSLSGAWRFTPLGAHGCKVDFSLDYEFSSKLLEKTVGPVFGRIAESFVEAFVKRAEVLFD